MDGSEKFLIIGITRPEIFSGSAADFETERIINLLTNEVIDYLHLRKPEATSRQLKNILDKIPDNLLSGITLHDHYELIMESGIGGVHINSRTPDFWLRDFEEKCRLPKSGTGIRISKSFHSLNELAASCLPLDYATLSPIYDSISKTGYKSHFQNKSELSGAIGQSSFPIVALGGVTPDKFNELRALGFGGAAMLGALF